MALELEPGPVTAGVDGWDAVLVGPVVDGVVRLTWADGASDVVVKDADEFAALLGTGAVARVAPGQPHFREVAWWHRGAQIVGLAGVDADASSQVALAPVFAVDETASPLDADNDHAAALTSYVTAWLTTALREGGDLLVEPVAPAPDVPTPFVRCWVAEGRLFTKVFPVPDGPDWAAFEGTDFALTAVDHDVADPYAQDLDVLSGVVAGVVDAALGWGLGALGVVATLDLAAPEAAARDAAGPGETLVVDSPRSLVAMLEEWLTAHADRPDVRLGASSGLGRIIVQHPHLTIDVDVAATPAGVRFWLDRWYGSPHLALVPDPAQSPADVRREGRRCVVTVGQWLHTVDGCLVTATLTDHAPGDLQEWADSATTPWWLGPAPGRVDYTRPNWFRATLPRSSALVDDVVAYVPGATAEARTLRHLQVLCRFEGRRVELVDLDVRLGVAAASRDVTSGASLTVPPISEPFLRRLSADQFLALSDRVLALVERALAEATGAPGDVLDVHFDDRVAVVRTWRELRDLGVAPGAARLFAELLVEAEERDVDAHLDFAHTETGIGMTWDGAPWVSAVDAVAHANDAPEAGGLRRVAVNVISRRQAPGS